MLVIFLVQAGLFSSCIEVFDPEIKNYENLLVVDGLLTNDEPAAVVYLSRSFPYNSSNSIKEKGAEVSIVDESGNLYLLNEQSAGKYVSGSTLTPLPGGSYTLHITTSDGKQYRSFPQQYLPAPPIDSVYYEVSRGTDQTEGVSLFLDARGEEQASRYYRWEWEECWLVISPFFKPGAPNICWSYDLSRGVFIGSTAQFEENIVKKQKLYFLGTTSNKLSQRYSTLVKQYAITHENFVYLTKLKELNESAGGFFDPIPAALTGNIKNTADPNIPVLGIFEASEHSSKRIFIDRSDLYISEITTGYEQCEMTEISLGDYRRGVLINWNFVEMYFNSRLNDTMVVLVNKEFCYDCSKISSSARPDFWIDKVK
ncbi:MAG: DUF4249 domain-containing protein [Bacteroidales bacterium]